MELVPIRWMAVGIVRVLKPVKAKAIRATNKPEVKCALTESGAMYCKSLIVLIHQLGRGNELEV